MASARSPASPAVVGVGITKKRTVGGHSGSLLAGACAPRRAPSPPRTQPLNLSPIFGAHGSNLKVAGARARPGGEEGGRAGAGRAWCMMQTSNGSRSTRGSFVKRTAPSAACSRRASSASTVADHPAPTASLTSLQPPAR
jgi:hypothetical protein